MGENAAPQEPIAAEEAKAATLERRAFLLTFGLGLLTAPAAFGLGSFFGIILDDFGDASLSAAMSGVIATAPLLVLLHCFMKTRWTPLVDFRNSQLDFFSEIGFRLTRPRIILLALLAGVTEEILFRGVLQTAAMRQFPLVAAIALPSLVFGLLHARTVLYAVIATLVGAYLGILFWATNSLLAPIVTHVLYDYVAFDWTRRALDHRIAGDQSGRANSSGSSTTG